MSEVKRYSFWPQIVHLPAGGGVRAEVHFKVEEDGLFVAHQDYASLKAEVERLRASSFVTAVPVEQYERLREAGDDLFHALAGMHLIHRGSIDTTKQKNLVKWNAAKEGKPSV
jgi:hypothetical protein